MRLASENKRKVVYEKFLALNIAFTLFIDLLFLNTKFKNKKTFVRSVVTWV